MLKLYLLSEEQSASARLPQKQFSLEEGTTAFVEWEKMDNQEQGFTGAGL